MPLQDHFRPPLGARRHWTGFHSAWATYISESLNARLPEGYFATPNVHFAIEIDVATYEEAGAPPTGGPAVSAWAGGAPQLTLPFAVTTDIIEVQVLHEEGGPVLVGAVELVSPGNKDRPSARDAFVNKCAAYLQEGVGLVLADVVTERRANLHEHLLRRVTPGGPVPAADLYAAAYHPLKKNGETSLDVWHEPLAVGRPLPTLPLWLRGGLCLPVDLEETYEVTCSKQRVRMNGA